jgi:glycosyltransferase involved in cell wall biosynthesis
MSIVKEKRGPTRTAMQRLLIVDETPIYRYGDIFSMPNPMNIFFENLADHFREIVLSCPTCDVAKERIELGMRIDTSRLRISPRPFFDSPMSFYRQFPGIIGPSLIAILHAIRATDVVLLRLPLLLGAPCFAMASILSRKIVIHHKGSWGDTVRLGLKGPLRLPAMALVAGYEALDRLMLSRRPFMVTGHEKFRQLKRLNPEHSHRVSVNLLSSREVFFREDSCQGKVIHLLFVGRLSLAKGIGYLIGALSLLKTDRPIVLDIVGDGPEIDILKAQAGSLDAERAEVRFHGQLPHGRELFSCYKKADIFVLPSISEGLPKVIFEAMANSVPIVCTCVGGIEKFLINERSAMIVLPGSPEALAGAIERIINNHELRRSLIREVRNLFPAFSVETLSRKYAEIVLNETRAQK